MKSNDVDRQSQLLNLVRRITREVDGSISESQLHRAANEALSQGASSVVRKTLRQVGLHLVPVDADCPKRPLLVREGGLTQVIVEPQSLEPVAGLTFASPQAEGDTPHYFVAEPRFMLQALHNQNHIKRLTAVLRWERRDVVIVAILAAATGVFSLATPLAVQTVFDVLAFGTLIQPLVVVSSLLLLALAFSAGLRLLESWSVELIARRLFVRAASDFSRRLPQLDTQGLSALERQKKAARFLDVAIVEKSAATLLFEGSTATLQILIGLLLLAFYHPFLLAFDFVLICGIAVVIGLLGRGGIRTADLESKNKYKIADWLSEVARSPRTFRSFNGQALAERRTETLVSEWLSARQSQFRIQLRQFAGMIVLQVIATVALLLIGGALVVAGQLTFGQLVAAEVVMTATVASLTKIGKLFAKAYDLFASLGKLASVVDLPQVPEGELLEENRQAMPHLNHQDLRGRQVALLNGSLQETMQALSLGDQGAQGTDPEDWCEAVVVLDEFSLFEGTVLENLRLERATLPRSAARDLLQEHGLVIDLDASVGPAGARLSPPDRAKLLWARARAGSSSVVVVDHIFDVLDPSEVNTWLHADPATTVVCITRRPDIASQFAATEALS